MSKYGNRKTKVDGHTFDSKAEAARYRELKLLQRAGAIRSLKLQPRFELIPAFRDGSGKKHRKTEYVADFSYVDCSRGSVITEDVKGVQTAVFKLKMKLLLSKYPAMDFRMVHV